MVSSRAQSKILTPGRGPPSPPGLLLLLLPSVSTAGKTKRANKIFKLEKTPVVQSRAWSKAEATGGGANPLLLPGLIGLTEPYNSSDRRKIEKCPYGKNLGNTVKPRIGSGKPNRFRVRLAALLASFPAAT